jgi:hypothetical protein
VPRHVPLHRYGRREPLHGLRRRPQVDFLFELDPGGGNRQTPRIVCAGLVGDEDDGLDVVDLRQESNLLLDASRVIERLKPIGERDRAARQAIRSYRGRPSP